MFSVSRTRFLSAPAVTVTFKCPQEAHSSYLPCSCCYFIWKCEQEAGCKCLTWSPSMSSLIWTLPFPPPLLSLCYSLRALLSASVPRCRALPWRAGLVGHRQGFIGSSSRMDPESSAFRQPCWNLLHHEACKVPSISAAVLPIVYHAFQGVIDSNLVDLCLWFCFLVALIVFNGKFREIKTLNCHNCLIPRMVFSCFFIFKIN